MWQFAVLFILGGLLGAWFDSFHTFSGTSYYPHVSFYKMAWWVLPEFGLATVVIALTHRRADALLGRVPKYLSWSEVLAGLALFGIQYYISGYLFVPFTAKFILLGFISLCVWQVFEGTLSGLWLGLATAFFGCLAESLLSVAGQFHYTEPHAFGIPLWLPFLYITASVTVANLGRKLYEGESRPRALAEIPVK